MLSFIYYRADPNNVVVLDGEVTTAKPSIGGISSYSLEEAPKKMTLKEVFEELERFEGELFEVSFIIKMAFNGSLINVKNDR